MCMPIGIAKSAAQNTTPDLPPGRLKITCSLPVVLALRDALQPNTAPMSRRHRWSRRCLNAGLGAPAAAAPAAAAAAAAHLGWIQDTGYNFEFVCKCLHNKEYGPLHIDSTFGLSSSAATPYGPGARGCSLVRPKCGEQGGSSPHSGIGTPVACQLRLPAVFLHCGCVADPY